MVKPLLVSAISLLLAAHSVSAEEPVVHVYNWNDYIGETTIEDFTRETGIKVVYDLYDSNDVLEAKLMAGRSGYDVVFPTAQPNGGRQIKAGLLRELDRSKLTLWDNLDPNTLGSVAAVDPGNKHLVPYMWGPSGIGYNVKMVAERLGADTPVDSWSILFDPAVSSKLADCGIGILDSQLEGIAAILAFHGRDPRVLDKESLDFATDAFSKVRPNIRYFHSSQYINDLANGDVCVVMGYSGDILQAAARAEEAKNGVEIQFAIPKEGALLSVDVMAIPSDAPHPDNAHTFINYMLRPEVIAAASNYVAYPNANRAATPLVDEAMRNNPGVYPPDEVRARLFVIVADDAKTVRSLSRAWTRIKTGE